METVKPDFNFFVPIDIDFEKAVRNGGSKYDNMLVQGVGSDETEDSDEETLEPSGFELDRFVKMGFINYDHRAKDDPKYIIGEPLEAKVINNKFVIKGKLFKESEIARNTYDMMETLKKSGSTRAMGWSIEGKALERHPSNKKRITKALITGIALTPNPKNSNTYADIVKGEYSQPINKLEFEYSQANGGNIEYLVVIEDKEKGLKYMVDKNLKLTVEKSISTTTAQPLIKESLEGKKKAVLNVANAVVKGIVSNNVFEKAISLFRIKNAINSGILPEDILEKAKYIRREGTAGNYKYIYKEIDKPSRKEEIEENSKQSISKEEIDSINDYTSMNYRKINRVLRSGNIPEDLMSKIHEIDSGLDKLPKVKGEVFRGMSIPDNVDSLLEQWGKGSTITMDSFTSTSQSEKVAKSFGDFQIKLTSKTGADISDISGLQEEKEVLFKIGAEFKVKSIKIKKMKTPFGDKVVSINAVLEEI